MEKIDSLQAVGEHTNGGGLQWPVPPPTTV
jgi:hypothetical protein